jgi:hypothetical protein
MTSTIRMKTVRVLIISTSGRRVMRIDWATFGSCVCVFLLLRKGLRMSDCVRMTRQAEDACFSMKVSNSETL